MSSQNQSLITCSVGIVGQLGVWDKKPGVAVKAPAQKYRPGGMGPPQVFPALSMPDDLTLTRVYQLKRDIPLATQLKPLVGLIYGTVTEQPLDPNGNAFGKPTVYTGLLTSVDTGDADSDSNAIRFWMISFAIVGVTN